MKISREDKQMAVMAIVMVVLLVTIPLLQKGLGQTFEAIPNSPNIAEDQIIVCVNHVVQEFNSSHIDCHLYQSDHLDWYQDAKDGTFFSHEDVFEMGLVD